MGHVGAIADCEHIGMAERAQLRIDPDIAVFERQAGVGEPGLRRSACGPCDEGCRQAGAIRQVEAYAVMVARGDRRQHADPAAQERLFNRVPDRSGQFACQHVAGLDEGHTRIALAGPDKRVAHRYCQLAAGHTPSNHHRLSRRLSGLHFAEKCLPGSGERAERLGWHGANRPRRVERQAAGDPDIDRGDVEADLSARCQPDAPARRIEPDRAILDKSCPGMARKADKVDVKLAAGIVAGNMARQHAGIGGRDHRVDQREPHTGQRVHAPLPQHQPMTVPAADKHQFACPWNDRVHGSKAVGELLGMVEPAQVSAHIRIRFAMDFERVSISIDSGR